jgi:hypothetical protein
VENRSEHLNDGDPSRLEKLLMTSPVQKSIAAEIANLDSDKQQLEVQ